MELADRVALVTGGGTGLGRAICLALAQRGCHVAIDYLRSEADAMATARAATALGVRALPIRADVTNAKQVAAMVGDILATMGHLDILVNNAGTTIAVPMRDLAAVTEEAWDRVMAVNLKAALLCTQAVAPAMKRQAHGKVINISSNAGLRPGAASLPYSVSKAGLLMLTKCLAVGLAPEIQVNAIAPGLMLTRWWADAEPATVERIAQTAATRRPTEPGEVAGGVLFLAQNDAITGQTLVIDGGTYMH
ncbi:MAG: SDR family NAD(P)-dependent oxidoreductase [Chloroflexi bacterium]|nr:SDR family NAD(P)-dependent oxidoreductase [Chloroflexota bacterium]